MSIPWALHWAASSDDVHVAAALIDAGADIDAPAGAALAGVLARVCRWPAPSGRLPPRPRRRPARTPTTPAGHPERSFDSRFDSPYPAPGKIADDSTLVLGEDTSLFSAWVFNVTATATEASGFVTLYPYPSSSAGSADPPAASNLDYEAGKDVANAVIARTGPRVGLYNRGGAAHLIVDTFGAFTS